MTARKTKKVYGERTRKGHARMVKRTREGNPFESHSSKRDSMLAWSGIRI
jgi:hypothetical protein